MKAPNAGFGRVAGFGMRVLCSRIGRLVFTTLLLSDLGSSQSPPADVTKHLDLARQYLDQESYRNAIVELRAATAIYPNIRGAYYQLGFALFKTGNLPEAERAFTKELDFDPPDPYSLYYLATIRSRRGEVDQSIALFEKSLTAGEVLDVRQRLGAAYLARGRIELAVRFLETSIRVRPEDGALHYLLGRAYRAAGRNAESRVEFAATERWKAKARVEMEMLTRLHQSLVSRNGEDAAVVTRELTASKDADVLLAAGITLGQAGLHSDAAALLEKAITIQPGFAEAHYDLGRAYLALNDEIHAEAELQRAAELRPGFYEAEVLLGTLLADKGERERAIVHLRAAVATRSDNPKVLMLLGLQYFQQRYYVDAIDVLTKAARLDPDNPEPRFLLIQARYRNLEYEPALRLAQETLERFPDNALAHYHVGAQLNNLGKLPEARQQLESALARDAGLVEARVMLGDVLFKLGRPDESIAQFRQALAADDKLTEARAGIGRALIQMKRYPEAAVEMEKAIQLDGRLAPLHLYLSQAYRALGRPDEASRQVEVFNRLNVERAAARDKDVERKYGE